MTTPEPRDWFLSRRARGNPATTIDAAHTGADTGAAHSTGNLAHPLIHGSTYFAELYRTIEATGAGDLVWFTDWQSDPDQQLTDDPASTLLEVLGRAVDRGVDVRALVWRSQPSFAGYAHEEHRELGKALQERGAEVLLDMRVRRGGAHHQKFCVVRHAEAQHRDVAFVGGIDLCHGRRDDALHGGDPQPEEMSSEYGPRPPWHDVQVALRGPVVHDVETVFRERWDDPIPTTRHPLRRLRDAADGLDRTRSPLPLQSPPPPPVPGADHAVQLLRTYPALGWGWSHGFAPRGERSVARGYTKSIGATRKLIYIEDQFLWGGEMSSVLVRALEKNPDLHAPLSTWIASWARN